MENEKDLQSEEIAEETAIPEEETAEASAPEKDGKDRKSVV